MSENAIETPWGDVTLVETRFPVDDRVHETSSVEVRTRAGKAVAAFTLHHTQGDREDDAVPEGVLMVLYGGYFNSERAPGLTPVGESTLLRDDARLRWRAEVPLDPMAPGIPERIGAATTFVDDRGRVAWAVGDASPRLRAMVREALAEAWDRDPTFLPRLYAGMMETTVRDMADEAVRAKGTLDVAEARFARARKAVDAATDLVESARAPRP